TSSAVFERPPGPVPGGLLSFQDLPGPRLHAQGQARHKRGVRPLPEVPPMPERPASPDARPTSMPAAFRPVPRTGVIYVTEEAANRGFTTEAEDWCNLGQGQPETGALPGAPERLGQVSIDVGDQEYAPVAGLPELREAIAE